MSTKTSLFFALILLFALESHSQDCSSVATCVECFTTDGCGAWAPVAGCLESCNVIADASCYTNTTFPDLNVEETCQAAAGQQADAQLCSSKTTCGECVATTLSDGNTTCQWFTVTEYCGSACDMNGCGEMTCDDPCDGLSCTDCLGQSCAWIPIAGCSSNCSILDTSCFPGKDCNASEVCGTDCEGLLSCEECLDGESCAWAPVAGCLASCSMIADTSCFPAENYNASDVCNLTGSDAPTSLAAKVSILVAAVVSLIASAILY